MTNANDLRYDGSGTSATAMDFLRGVNLIHDARTTPFTDAQKLRDVGNRFNYTSAPDRWFRAATTLTTWDLFTAAFEARFANTPVTIKPLPQRVAELQSMRITERDLVGEDVVVAEGTLTPFNRFQARLRLAILDAEAGTSAEGLWAFHHALPLAFRATIITAPANWDAMLFALQTLPTHVVDGAVEDSRRASKEEEWEREKARMGAQMAVMQRTLAGMSLAPGRQQQQGAAVVQQRAPGAAAADQQRGGVGNARVARVAMGRGGNTALPGATEATKTQLLAALEGSYTRQHPDTQAGKTAYAADVRAWHARNPNASIDTAPLWVTGFPLTPGTDKPRTGECWTCGKRTRPTHNARDCTGTRVPEMERRFRTLAGVWLGMDVPPRATPVVTVNVVEVEAQPVQWWEDGEGAREEVFD
ncbi:hypothetical protein FB45DRAFT_1080867 [Roridomyces roridus]|uniref:CCHC-type domain-containing protein n=1 Tax=Roridomyces roridus TaxID=1738132 RepID=A0AAD7F6A8_9AGAR|nr:hypothetical protein FB45DRAFT_1080867 [Roridomyces roridus]